MKTLDEWLAWQQRVHPREIEMGLDRVRAVWQRLGARRPAPCVIAVGGTNGKGSTVALLDAMLSAGGHATGCYTSPHLLRYNERIRLRGKDVTDEALIAVFERIEATRNDTLLTWFEHGTLAALELIADAELDVAILEVGLGGRLDAVNIVDADAAIVSSVGIDHVEYLGPTRDCIGTEKAGIFRADRPAIVGDPDPPQGLLDTARAIGAGLLLAGVDFGIEKSGDHYLWSFHPASGPSSDAGCRETLPLNEEHLDSPARKNNLAAALAALYSLRARLGWHPQSYAMAAAEVHPPARVQRIASKPEVIVDVAHNPQAAAALATWLRAHPVSGRTVAVFSAMADKDIAGIVAELAPLIGHWHVCPLPQAGQRGLDSDAAQHRVVEGYAQAQCSQYDSVEAALDGARAGSGPDDRVIAFGSFHLAGAVLGAKSLRGTTPV